MPATLIETLDDNLFTKLLSSGKARTCSLLINLGMQHAHTRWALQSQRGRNRQEEEQAFC